MRTELQMRVSFYPRNKKGSKGESPIMMRVSLNGSRISLGQVGLSVNPDMITNNRVVEAHPQALQMNETLEKLEQKVIFTAEQLFNDNNLSLDTLRSALNGKKTHLVYMSQLFDLDEEEMSEKLSTGKITATTYRRHLCARRNFEDFLSFKYRRKDIKAGEVTKSVIHDYEDYLGSYVGYDRNTVVKYMFLLGKPIKYAYCNELIDRNPFYGLSFPKKKTDRGYLTDDELALLSRARLVLQRLDVVRDMFLFSCFTGLSYIDVRNLTEDDIKIINGKKWIFTPRQKTSTPCQILLLSQAERIIDKYKDKRCEGGRLLPLFSNQKTNQYLKEIAQECGITKNLTFHLARHTFATMALTKGMSIEAVSKVLGHTNIQTTQIYARVIPTKIEEEMGRLATRLNHEQIGLEYGENNGVETTF